MRIMGPGREKGFVYNIQLLTSSFPIRSHHCSGGFTYIISLNPPNNPMSVPVLWMKQWGLERLIKKLKVRQLLREEFELWAREAWCQKKKTLHPHPVFPSRNMLRSLLRLLVWEESGTMASDFAADRAVEWKPNSVVFWDVLMGGGCAHLRWLLQAPPNSATRKTP